MRGKSDMAPLPLLLACTAAGPATQPSSRPLEPSSPPSVLTMTEHLASVPSAATELSTSRPSTRPDDFVFLVIPMKVPAKFLDAITARANLKIEDFNTLSIEAAPDTEGRKMILLLSGISGAHIGGNLLPLRWRNHSYTISPEIHACYRERGGFHMIGEVRYTFPREPKSASIVYHAKFDAHVKVKSNVGWSGMHPVSADIRWSGVAD